MFACKHGRLDVVKLLVKAGADLAATNDEVTHALVWKVL